MNKNNIHPMPEFFDKYITIVNENDLLIGLENSLKHLETYEISILKNIKNKVYETNKWTVKDILQHIIDTERIMAYRALRIARNDKTILPGYDEVLFAKNTNTSKRTIDDLFYELILIRKSTILLFKSLKPNSVQYNGTCNGQQISALALGFVIIGHQQHHFNTIKEKYEVLISK